MKKTLLTVLLCLLPLLPGCQPEGIIPPEEMQSMLGEFYKADAMIELLNDGSYPVKLDSMRVYLPIVEAHGYTKEVFRTSLEYYLHHPDKLVKIYDRLRAQLEQEASRPARMAIEEEEEEEGIGEDVRTMAPSTGEGTEPAIERPEEPQPEKPARQQRKTRKKLNKEDLKRLEEELK